MQRLQDMLRRRVTLIMVNCQNTRMTTKTKLQQTTSQQTPLKTKPKEHHTVFFYIICLSSIIMLACIWLQFLNISVFLVRSQEKATGRWRNCVLMMSRQHPCPRCLDSNATRYCSSTNCICLRTCTISGICARSFAQTIPVVSPSLFVRVCVCIIFTVWIWTNGSLLYNIVV